MPFRHQVVVRWRDCDMYQHVNNAVYLTYFEEARGRFWQVLKGPKFDGFDFIIAEITCTYLSPAKLGEELVVVVEVGEVGNKSFQLSYTILENESGRTVAKGRSAQVMYDHAKQESFVIPDEVRASLTHWRSLGKKSTPA
ncbi:MAG TPA: thioesterase family protein [Oscillatoriaceae cyanobacterium]